MQCRQFAAIYFSLRSTERSQFHWQGKGVKADYQAIRKVMQAVKGRFAGKRIGYPKIGAGLAGGDWEIIGSIIDDELAGEDHTLVEYAP